jgi:hypothetical protein
VFELMSYCGGTGQGTWPGSHTWGKLTERLSGGAGAGGGGGGGGAWKADTPVLVVQGQVDLATDQVTLLPNAVVTSTFAPLVPVGDWALVQKDTAGDVLSTTPFSVDPIEAKQVPGAPAVPSIGSFAVPVVYDANTRSLEITHAQTVVVKRVASANAPTITVTSPTENATLSGDTDVSWTAADADGDPLRFSVQYSPDDGLTWSTLSDFQTDTHVVVPEGVLAGSGQGAFRVIASDGFHANSSTVRFLHVPNLPPRVQITDPTAGSAYFGAQPVTLAATIHDQEDGNLTPDRVTWTSDRDGVIGQGDTASIPASTLSEGDHVLTVTATDSAGVSSTASTTISIARIAPPDNDPPVILQALLSPASPQSTFIE